MEEGGEGAAVVGGFGRMAGVWGSTKLLPRSGGHWDGGGCGESIFVDGGSAVRIQWLFIAVRWCVGLDVFGREGGGLFLYVRVGEVDVGDSKEKGVFVCLRPCRSALPVEEMGLRYLEVIASGVVERCVSFSVTVSMNATWSLKGLKRSADKRRKHTVENREERRRIWHI